MEILEELQDNVSKEDIMVFQEGPMAGLMLNLNGLIHCIKAASFQLLTQK